MFIALEMGIGAGALISAWIYNNNSDNFSITFLISSLMSALALIYLFYYSVRQRKMFGLKVPVTDSGKK